MSDLRTQLRTYFEATTNPTQTEPIPDLSTATDGPRDLVGTGSLHRLTGTDSAPTTTSPDAWWKRAPAVAAAVIAIVALVLAGFWLGTGGSEVAPAGETDREPIVTTAPANDQEPAAEAVDLGSQALAVADQLYDALDQGDLSRVMALFAADAQYTGLLFDGEAQFRQLVARDHASQVEMVGLECRTSSNGGGLDTTITCEFGWSSHLDRAVGAPPLGAVDTFNVSESGEITFFNARVENEGWIAVRAPFLEWAATAHPNDVSAMDCCEFDSIEDAVAGATLESRYADEYAAYLEENGCVYNELCNSGS